LEILVEIHNEEELDKISPLADLVGVNNRNLKTFEVDIQNSIRLSKLIPNQFIKISESGLSDVSTIFLLKEYGFKGFLIGETFMKTKDPVKTCSDFISKIKA
ncbi:MAG: indole-3-glycerol-phosphate synthase TrpC, partial [Mariniphaga sp.]|nr:indole-3-glycerol-phosphate synthase TrpC [Mariniphaga sp.]